MPIEIRHRYSGEILLTVPAGTLRGADLRFAILRDANLQDADLRGADLRGADLDNADLRFANLQDAGLRGADLRFANMYFANLQDADLRGAYLSGADLEGANLRGADLGHKIPVVANLHQRVADAVGAHGERLHMESWHAPCGTAHCRAGWAITLAGDAGRELEKRVGSDVAGRLIYHASTGETPDFYAQDAEALADIMDCARRERRSNATTDDPGPVRAERLYNRARKCRDMWNATDRTLGHSEMRRPRAGKGGVMDWCWYREGGTFRNGFASRAEALRDAADEGEDGTIYVGTTMDAVDAMTMYAHASDLAEHIEENMNVDGCRVRVGPGAEEALRQWVRDHLEFDAPVVCLNGDVPSRDEWREVCAGPVPGKGE